MSGVHTVVASHDAGVPPRLTTHDSRLTCLALLTAAILCRPISASAAETVERTVPADPRGKVEIVCVSGDIHVQGWDRNEVQVTGLIGGSAQRLDIRSSAKHTLIQVETERGRSVSADLKVRVPLDSALSINTVSADQAVDNLKGTQHLQAVSGDITTALWSEDIEAKTISGDVEVRGHSGDALVSVTTVSGEIVLSEAPAEFELETVSGDMRIATDRLRRGRIRTTNGEVELKAKLSGDARLDAEAINGDLRFELARPVDAQFDVETFNGEIDNCFGPKPVRIREFGPGKALRFTEGAGEARVRVKTLNGAVNICSR